MLGSFTSEDLDDGNMAKVLKEIDPYGAGELSKDSFMTWYLKSEKRIQSQVKVQQMRSPRSENRRGCLNRCYGTHPSFRFVFSLSLT